MNIPRVNSGAHWYYPLVIDRFETYCRIETELDRKIKAGTVPPGTPPPAVTN